LPVPEVEVENVTQGTGVEAVQEQPLPVVTATLPVPAAAVSDALAGAML
jgi:hypothetical protein